MPRAILGRVKRFSFVRFFDALINVFGKTNVIALMMRQGTNDVNVEHTVRRRLAELELCRLAFARGKDQICFRSGVTCQRQPGKERIRDSYRTLSGKRIIVWRHPPFPRKY